MYKNFTLCILLIIWGWGTTFAQNVGIGTLTPTEKLHVQGTMRVTSLGGSGNALVLTNNNGVLSSTALSGNGTDVFTGAGTFVAISSIADGWKLLGNTGTTPATNFLGTIDAQDLVIRTSNIERMRMTSGGNLGVGTTAPGGRLHVSNADGSRMIFGSSGNLSVYDAETFVGEVRLGAAWNRPGVYSSQQLELFSDATGVIFGDSNIERMRMTAAGDFGVGTAAPATRLHVLGFSGDENSSGIFRIDAAAGPNFRFGVVSGNRSWMQSHAGLPLHINRLGNNVILNLNGGQIGMGIETLNANAKLQVANGSIMPSAGNAANAGIYFPPNPGGGGGDEAYIRYYAEAGENTKLVIANQNDADDDLDLQTGGQSRLNIDGDGSIRIDEGVLFDCDDCGSASTIDGTDNWGNLIVQGRVLSTNSNLHLSPPGGNRVIINSTYRAAGGGGGQVGLDVDGGIRMRKNYYYFQRYLYCNCYGAGSGSWAIGNYDFCAVAQVGFKNNQSTTDEDDDVQCAVYPDAHVGYGETTNYNTSFTYQYNGRPHWRMYAEAYEDTNGVTCAANCINFD